MDVTTACSIGIMHPAFSVSKRILLEWINNDFSLNYKKVEDCASGAIYCQLLDCIFGGIKMGPVKWDAKTAYDFSCNWKIVQKCFTDKKIPKNIEVQKLCNAKFQDNLEFLQWMKHFFDSTYDGHEYDAVVRRSKSKTAGSLAKRKPKSTEAKTSSSTTGTKRTGMRGTTATKTTTSTRTGTKKTSTNKTGGSKTGGAASAKQAKEIAELKEQLAEIQQTAEGLEKERDYYYETLRNVEEYCQDNPDDENETKKAVLGILYQNDEAGEGDEAEAEAEAEAEPAAAEEDDDIM